MTEEKESENVDYCEYCWKLFPIDELIEEEIWINGRRAKKLFCCKEHASYCQMGAEG
jgi:hypothetical protein